MKLNVIGNGFEAHAALLKKTVAARVGAEAENEMTVALAVDASIGAAESYCITQTDGGWQITGADEAGLYFGIGKFLHSRFKRCFLR